MFIGLFMVFEDANVSIQIFNLDFGAAVADASSCEAIGAKDDLAAVFLALIMIFLAYGRTFVVPLH